MIGPRAINLFEHGAYYVAFDVQCEHKLPTECELSTFHLCCLLAQACCKWIQAKQHTRTLEICTHNQRGSV